MADAAAQEESQKIRHWLLAILRFAVTLDPSAVLAMAEEMDRLGSRAASVPLHVGRGTKCSVAGWAVGETGDFKCLTLSNSSPVLLGTRGFSLNRGRAGETSARRAMAGALSIRGRLNLRRHLRPSMRREIDGDERPKSRLHVGNAEREPIEPRRLRREAAIGGSGGSVRFGAGLSSSTRRRLEWPLSRGAGALDRGLPLRCCDLARGHSSLGARCADHHHRLTPLVFRRQSHLVAGEFQGDRPGLSCRGEIQRVPIDGDLPGADGGNVGERFLLVTAMAFSVPACRNCTTAQITASVSLLREPRSRQPKIARRKA
jgi:hypothetical protein